MEAIEAARAKHWEELSESAGALGHNLRIVMKAGGVSSDEDIMTGSPELTCTAWLEYFLIDFGLSEKDGHDLKPVNRGDYLLDHLRAEFPQSGLPSDWDFLQIQEIKEILGLLSLVEARRTFENSSCRVCEKWESTPRSVEMPSAEAVNLYIGSCTSRALSPVTTKQYASTLKRYIKENPQLPKTPKPVEAFLDQFTPGNSRAINFTIIRGFHRFLHENYGVTDPTYKMKKPKIRKKIADSLSGDELIRLFQHPMSKRDRAALGVLSGCGLRVGEAVNLKFCHIGDEQLKVSGKTGDRYVPLMSNIRKSLLALQNGHNNDDPVFWGEHPHQPLGSSGFQGLVEKAFKLAGLTDIKQSPHTLRHTFGRNWIVQGGDVVSLQGIMGHSSLEMTQRYTNLEPIELISKNKKYNPLSSIFNDDSITPPDDNITSFEQSITPLDDNLTQC